MSQPVQNLLHAQKLRPVRQDGAVDHQNRQSKQTRGIKLGARAGPARVLRNNQLRTVVFHQRAVIVQRERAARNYHIAVRKRWGRGGIHQPKQVVMMRLTGKILKMHSAHGQEHAPRWPLQFVYGGRDIRDVLPLVACLWAPFGSGQSRKRRAGQSARLKRILAHLRGKRMCRVDDMTDPVLLYVARKTFWPSKPSDADRNGLRARRIHAPGIRIDGPDTPARNGAGQGIGLGRAAKDQEVGHA